MKSRLRSLLIGEFSWRRVVRSIVLIPVCVVLGLLVIATVFPERLIFQPRSSSYRDTAEIIKLRTNKGGDISAKFYEHSKASYTILFSHGNAEDIGVIDPFIRQLRDLGFNVLTYDHQGYGTSSGAPSEENAYSDIETAYNYLVKEKGIGPDRIILHGRSLGGAVAVDLASRGKVAALILESTLGSAFRVVTRYPILPFDKFESIKKIDKVTCPILIIHGTDDSTIPIYHGERLFEASKSPKYSYWVQGAEHNNVFDRDESEYLNSIARFVETLVAP